MDNIFSNYLTSRLANGPQFGQSDLTDEEQERRRRWLATMGQATPTTEQKATPVTQTIKTDPRTGEQTMTISGSVNDLSPTNPLTPTVVSPDMLDRRNPQVPGYTTLPRDMTQPTPADFVQKLPSTPGQQMGSEAIQLLKKPAPAAPVSPEQSSTGPARLQPITRPEPVAQPNQAAAPVAQPQPSTPGFAPPTTDYAAIFQQSQTDPAVLSKIAFDKTAPDWVRRAAADQQRTMLNFDKGMSDAEKTVMSTIGKPGGGLALDRLIKKEGDEGSYIKAYLYKRFGLDDLAKTEQQKLGAGSSWLPSMVDGQQVLIKYNAQGLPVAGVSPDGDMTSDQLLRAQGSMKDAQVNATLYRDQQTGELYGVRRNQGQVQIFNTATGAVIRDPSIQSRLVPDTTGSNLALQNALQLQKLRNTLVNIPKEERAKYISRFNAEYGTNFPIDLDITAMPPMTQGYPGMAPPVQGPVQQPVVRPGAAPGPQAAPVAPQAVTPSAAPQPAAPQAGPVAPAALAPTAAPAPRMGPTGAPTVAPQITGGSPAAVKAGVEVSQAAAKKAAEMRTEDVTKTAISQGKVEDNADYLINKINELTTHPGFERSVGLKGPGLLFGLREQGIAGTAEADWQSRFEEIGGRSFLEAFESLKGGGQISNVEGEKATRAIQRMKTSTSEKEFRDAANDFISIIKRGIDRSRKKLGQAPKYGEQPGGAGAQGLSREDQQALDWATKNPNDPRAAEIRRRLGR